MILLNSLVTINLLQIFENTFRNYIEYGEFNFVGNLICEI